MDVLNKVETVLSVEGFETQIGYLKWFNVTGALLTGLAAGGLYMLIQKQQNYYQNPAKVLTVLCIIGDAIRIIYAPYLYTQISKFEKDKSTVVPSKSTTLMALIIFSVFQLLLDAYLLKLAFINK